MIKVADDEWSIVESRLIIVNVTIRVGLLEEGMSNLNIRCLIENGYYFLCP